MKKYLFILVSLVAIKTTHTLGQACTANPSTVSSDTNFASISWTPSGGASAADCIAMAAGAAFTGDVILDLANNVELTISNDINITGNFPITGGPGSGLSVDGGGTGAFLNISGDLGEDGNNGVIYSVPNANDEIFAGGTVYGKNNNAFNGNGNIGGGNLAVKNGTTCGSPCPVSENFQNCTAGDSFCEDNSVVLPIVLGHFGAIPLEKSVELEWETISEENFDFFSIERSDDGENFYEIGTVPGHGNSNVRIQYSFEDKAPLFGISYYRLNAIDYDGSFEKFKAIAVEYIPEDLQLSMYPNPGNGSGLTVLLGLPIEARLKKVSVFELGGNLLFEKPLHTGINEITPEQRLTGGFYFAKFQIDNYQFTRKLIIK